MIRVQTNNPLLNGLLILVLVACVYLIVVGDWQIGLPPLVVFILFLLFDKFTARRHPDTVVLPTDVDSKSSEENKEGANQS
jgi:hypothetical protein